MEDVPSDLVRTISRHTVAYILCFFSELFRHYDLDPLDMLLVHAVMNANSLTFIRNPELDRRFGSLHTVEPDDLKRGVSRAALARVLSLPMETVRRRVDQLKARGILSEPGRGLIVPEANPLNLGNNHELQKTNVILLRKMFRDLALAGVELPHGV